MSLLDKCVLCGNVQTLYSSMENRVMKKYGRFVCASHELVWITLKFGVKCDYCKKWIKAGSKVLTCEINKAHFYLHGGKCKRTDYTFYWRRRKVHTY